MTPMVTYVAAGGRAAAPALARRTDDAGYHRLVGVGVATTALSHALGGARRGDDPTTEEAEAVGGSGAWKRRSFRFWALGLGWYKPWLLIQTHSYMYNTISSPTLSTPKSWPNPTHCLALGPILSISP